MKENSVKSLSGKIFAVVILNDRLPLAIAEVSRNVLSWMIRAVPTYQGVCLIGLIDSGHFGSVNHTLLELVCNQVFCSLSRIDIEMGDSFWAWSW